MASSAKTPNIGLNKWSGTDKPKRDDFNEDNRIIDEEMAKRAILSEDGATNWDSGNLSKQPILSTITPGVNMNYASNILFINSFNEKTMSFSINNSTISSGTVIGTLSQTYRPSKLVILRTWGRTPAMVELQVEVYVQANGNIEAYPPSASPINYMTLNPVSFI